MPDDARLKVVLCWHMHQPQYRDLRQGDYQLPWTYLHAIKDYTDMAAHLEAVPAARAVVNFAPILLEQIADYGAQAGGFLAEGREIHDPVLAALGSLPAQGAPRLDLLRACVRANESRMIRRFPAYGRLATMAQWFAEHPEEIVYLAEQFLADLAVWYHLAWLGETVRRGDQRVRRLLEKESEYTREDRRELLTVIHELLAGVVDRYRRLAEAGQVELSMTPYAHPMLPLLLDYGAAHDAIPDVRLPAGERYPGGEERARWQIREGAEVFRRYFGYAAAGCWPSEGGVSAASLKLLAEADFSWTASGEGVLRNSLLKSGHASHALKEAWLYRPYAPQESGITCFFRDDGLSDLIGFTYATWHADDAVANFIDHLERIAECTQGRTDRVVSIIMDGENAWEHYPENGYYFLGALYRRLAQHPRLALTTFSEYLEKYAAKRLPRLAAGSWVYGSFSTWIGSPDKNRGWDMLADAKRAFDETIARLDAPARRAAERQLAVCEGSDWFWWFGPDNAAQTVSEFERLYRGHLANLYAMLGVPPPSYLAQTFTHGEGQPVLGGVMRTGQAPR